MDTNLKQGLYFMNQKKKIKKKNIGTLEGSISPLGNGKTINTNNPKLTITENFTDKQNSDEITQSTQLLQDFDTTNTKRKDLISGAKQIFNPTTTDIDADVTNIQTLNTNLETLLSQIYSAKEKIKNARVNGVNLRSTVSKAFSNPNLGGSKYQMDSSGKPYYINECGYALPVGDASGNTDNNFTIPSITGNNNDNAELSKLLGGTSDCSTCFGLTELFDPNAQPNKLGGTFSNDNGTFGMFVLNNHDIASCETNVGNANLDAGAKLATPMSFSDVYTYIFQTGRSNTYTTLAGNKSNLDIQKAIAELGSSDDSDAAANAAAGIEQQLSDGTIKVPITIDEISELVQGFQENMSSGKLIAVVDSKNIIQSLSNQKPKSYSNLERQASIDGVNFIYVTSEDFSTSGKICINLKETNNHTLYLIMKQGAPPLAENILKNPSLLNYYVQNACALDDNKGNCGTKATLGAGSDLIQNTTKLGAPMVGDSKSGVSNPTGYCEQLVNNNGTYYYFMADGRIQTFSGVDPSTLQSCVTAPRANVSGTITTNSNNSFPISGDNSYLGCLASSGTDINDKDNSMEALVTNHQQLLQQATQAAIQLQTAISTMIKKDYTSNVKIEKVKKTIGSYLKELQNSNQGYPAKLASVEVAKVQAEDEYSDYKSNNYHLLAWSIVTIAFAFFTFKKLIKN